MKVTHQKNVYYLDLNKNLYRGYVETFIQRETHERAVVYKSSHLEIDEVTILQTTEQVSFEYFNSKASSRSKGRKEPDKKEDKELDRKENREFEKKDDQKEIEEGFTRIFAERVSKCYDSIKIKIPDGFQDTSFTIRIRFRPTVDSTSILWYKPVSAKDKHKEVVASNARADSSSVAPYIDTISTFELYYIIPNTEEVKVVSSGTFESIKEENKTIIYLYSTFSHPKYLIFAAGTYDQADIFSDNDKRKMFVPFSMPKDNSEVQGDLQALIKYIEGFTRTQELATCNVVFSLIDVGNLIARNMIVLKYSYLPSPRDIEMAYLLKRVLSEALCQQVYHFLNWSIYDAWIYIGFAGFLADYAVRYLLGNNEFLGTYFMDRQFVTQGDVHEPPLFYTLRRKSDIYTEFFVKKSRLVFHAMETNLSFAFLQKISDEIIDIRKPEADVEDLKRCFTPHFIKIVKDATGKDLKPFFDFYVFRPGVMRTRLQFQINKKKNSVRVTALHTPTSQLPGANKRLLNNIEIKSIELEGNFDHTVSVGCENIFFYHTRTKKKKREDEEETMPLLYLRVDPRRLEIFDYVVEQPDYMHIEQLQDKSVIGQLEAIESLREKPTLASCEALERLVDNAHAFYRVRIKAVYALRSIKMEEYDGLQRMIQYFIRMRCVPNSTILKSNEFGLVSYFIQKHLVKSIAQLEIGPDAISDTRIILAFLENILNFNDNSLSQFEDSWYISTVINLVSIHSCFLMCYKTPAFESERLIHYMNSADDNGYNSTYNVGSNNINTHIIMNENTYFQGDIIAHKDGMTDDKPVFDTKLNDGRVMNNKMCDRRTHSQILAACIDRLERFRVSDMVFPSNNNVITKTCILSYVRLAFYNKISLHRPTLECLAKYPNLYSIRLVAIEGLLLLYSDALPFVLSMAQTEIPFIIESILNIILRIILLDLRVHFLDTDEYDISLTEKLKEGLSRSSETLVKIYERCSTYVRITEFIVKLFAVSEGKHLSQAEYGVQVLERYDHVREECNRAVILQIPSTSKRVRISNMENLTILAFEETHILRLPRIRNYRPKSIREPPLKSLKIRLKPEKFHVKHTSDTIIRLKTKVKMSDSDVGVVLATRYRENPGCEKVDECISKSTNTEFFEWKALISGRITDLARGGAGCVKIYNEIERALVFALSYNFIVSKTYQAAKSLYAYIEYIFFNNAPIRESVTPMTDEMREKCTDLLEELIRKDEYAVFRGPVDQVELKNYADIVRIPICFEEIQSGLLRYRSLEAFMFSLHRVWINCMRYNDCRSFIVETAKRLKEEIETFTNGFNLGTASSTNNGIQTVNSLQIIKEMIDRNNPENLLDTIEVNSLRSWGELDSEMSTLKKKYSRSSHNGKLIVSALKSIRDQLWDWFLFDGVRVGVICE